MALGQDRPTSGTMMDNEQIRRNQMAKTPFRGNRKILRILFMAGLFVILVVMTACVFPSPEFPDAVLWTGAQGELWRVGSDVGDFELYFSDGEEIWLVANVYGLDHDEVLRTYEVSDDGSNLLILIVDSGRSSFPHGTCLSVFDIESPKAHLSWNRAYGWALCPVVQIVDTEVLQADIYNDRVEYTTPDGPGEPYLL